MVHSTWSDWFVTEEIEASEPDGLSVWYLGGNGFVFRTAETTLYLDPYFGDGSPPRTIRMVPVPMDPSAATLCDAVLVTHEHIDHVHPPSYGPLVEELDADVYAPEASYENPAYDGDLRVPEGQKNVVAAGDELSFGDVDVHVRGANDPDAEEPVTFVVEHGDETFFAAGDSRPAEAFEAIGEEFDLDVGVFAYGTVGNIVHTEDGGETYPTEWYNDGEQIAEAANALELDRLLPTHWDLWRGVGHDPKSLHEHLASYEYPRTLEVVRVGDRIDVGKPGVVRPKDLREGE